MVERDSAYLVDMLLAAQDAIGFAAEIDQVRFAASRLYQNAIIRALEIVGEAAGRVSRETRAQTPVIPWQSMIGMRHRLIHGYEGVDLALVWKVVVIDLPALVQSLEALILEARQRSDQ